MAMPLRTETMPAGGIQSRIARLLLSLSPMLFSVALPVSVLHAEIRFWVDAEGVTHFSNARDSLPEAASLVDAEGLEPIRDAWSDGITGPPLSSDSSFGNDRVRRLLRGALADLDRGEIARADSTLRGVLRLDPRSPEAHWYLALLARARGRFESAEKHLRTFLAVAGPEFASWRRIASMRLSAIAIERELADPDTLEGPLRLELVQGEHFRVEVDARLGEVSSGYATEVLGFLREARSEVSSSIGVEPLEPLGVVLYGRAAYVRAHAHRFSFQTIGFFDGRIHVASPAHPTDTLRGVLFHEYTHAVFREVTGGDRPYWLNEGLAERIERLSRGLAVSTRTERAAMRSNLETGAWIPLTSISRSFAGLTDERARDAYLQSVITVGFIHSRTQVEERRRLLQLIGQGFSIDQALHEVMGIDTDELDRAVQAEIRREFPEWTVPAAQEQAHEQSASSP
jgi:tetratricopeptide (TPR) repeat protein